MLPWQDGNPNILGNSLWMTRDKNQEYLLNCNWYNNFEIPLPPFLLTPIRNVLSPVFQLVHKILGPTSKYDMKWKCMGFKNVQ
jgi:hypothetical protein